MTYNMGKTFGSFVKMATALLRQRETWLDPIKEKEIQPRPVDPPPIGESDVFIGTVVVPCDFGL